MRTRARKESETRTAQIYEMPITVHKEQFVSRSITTKTVKLSTTPME